MDSPHSAPSPRYAVLPTEDLVETHRLVDRDRDAEVVLAPSRGGLVTRFRVADDDILYLDQATLRDHTQNVRGGIPVLFPIAGRLSGDAFTLDGVRVPMSQHGFARKLPWQLEATTGGDTEATATVALEHDEATLALWPFRFRLTFRYQLRDGALSIDQRVENLDDKAMPIHPGLHPYFRVEDWCKREARVPTRATHAFDNRRGAMTGVSGPIELGPGEIDLQLLDHGEPHATLDRPGAPAIDLWYGDPAMVVVLWSVSGRDFVCVEPWTARSDAINRGEAIWLSPGERHETILRISRSTA